MSWLLFLDESGHDHKSMPYEVRGGFAMHASKLWPFIQAVKALEQSTFGVYLHESGSEIKGSRLLSRDRFEWAGQSPAFDDASRRKHALNFLNSSRQGRKPRRDEFTAFGQGCVLLAEGILHLLKSHDAAVFAAIIPHVPKPAALARDYLRKDYVFLLERYFYFLEGKREAGLIVMDGSEKSADRRFVSRMDWYFTQTQTGRSRTQWIVPSPFFVESDMAYGVQIADLVIYCFNWGHRFGLMDAPTREEVVAYACLIQPLIWHGDGYRDGRVFKTHSVVYVPDPYEARPVQKQREEAKPSGPP